MLAKVIVHSKQRSAYASRAIAAVRLSTVLGEVEIWPVKHNAGFVANLLHTPAFLKGDIHTAFIEQHADFDLLAGEPGGHELSAAAKSLVERFDGGGPTGFRLNGAPMTTVRMRADGRPVTGSLDLKAFPSVMQHVSVVESGDALFVSMFGATSRITLDEIRGTGASHGLHDGDIEAPMPGKVTAVEVAAGDKVAKGQRLLTLEAMKMEHALTAPFDGTVAELNATAGAQVTEGAILVRIAADAPAN
jgi:3-methylcrotonyl-CoA carboxylase alpha subunit